MQSLCASAQIINGDSEDSAVTVGRQRHHHRLTVFRGGGLGDVVGGIKGGPQLGDGGGWSAQRSHHVEEVGTALAGGGHALRLGDHFGGALHAGARSRVLAAQQGQETPVKLGKRPGNRCDAALA